MRTIYGSHALAACLLLTLGCGERQEHGPGLGGGTHGIIPQGYYATVDISTTSSLRLTLHQVIDDHQRYPYSSTATDTWNILEQADEDPGDSGYILDIYKNASYIKVGGGTGSYNREHSWPSSFGFPNDNASNYPYSDCHHLFLSDSGYNSSRGNKPYRECAAGCSERVTLYNDGRGGGSGTYPGNSNWTTGSGVTGSWETWQGRRGDVARALLYLDLRYEGGTHGATGISEPDLRLTDDEALIDSGHTGSNESVAYMGMLATLLRWHDEDPVDSREALRNDAVYGYQGNRNPFVDHPEWVACAFQGTCGGNPPPVLHVAYLDGASVSAKGGWRAQVTIAVHDASHEPVADVAVGGSWSGGASGSASCTTSASGTCTLQTGKLKGNVPQATFSVTGLTLAGATYSSTANHDLDGDSDGTTIAVYKVSQHAAPAAAIVAPADASTVSGQVTIQVNASDDKDPAGSLAVEVSIDGGIYQTGTYNTQTGLYERILNTSLLADGPHTIDARATDSASGTGSAGQVAVTVQNSQPTGTSHCADLDDTSLSVKGGWRAQVTITVHDQGHQPVTGAQVSGSWISGASGGASCTTGAGGTCTVQSGKLKGRISSAAFQVTGITAAGLSYLNTNNHDPDGDSDGTTITLTAP